MCLKTRTNSRHWFHDHHLEGRNEILIKLEQKKTNNLSLCKVEIIEWSYFWVGSEKKLHPAPPPPQKNKT